MEPLRPGQRLPLLLIGDEENQLARAEGPGRVSRFHDDRRDRLRGRRYLRSDMPLLMRRYPTAKNVGQAGTSIAITSVRDDATARHEVANAGQDVLLDASFRQASRTLIIVLIPPSN
jgi:hypothetical protein